jgi:site-specific DNA recombinase
MKTIRAAIYARRSTDEHQVESLATQLDNARRFVIAKGYHVDPRHEFTDTASRAEFAPKRRPGFAAIREAAVDGQFDVIVTRDDSRLGGDMLRVATFAQEMTDADVRIVFYSTGEEMLLENETSRLLAVMRGYASESERRKIASRTREGAERKARRGLVAGGVVYGYENMLAPDGSGKIRIIDEKQAMIVREIFERYAKGEGLRKICKSLAERGVRSPRAGKRGIGAWVPSAVHAMLRRPLYIGRMEWGHVHKTYKSGTRVRTNQHRHELIVVDAPHLRIISDELWNAVQARVQLQKAPENKGGRPAFYLLSGVLRCGECNGPLTVINGKQGNETIKMYTCCRRRDRGGTVCPSTLRREVDSIDGAVLSWIRGNVLTEEYVTEVIAEARRRIEDRESTHETDNEQLDRMAKKLRTEVDKFAEMALEAPDDARAVFFAKVSERQKQLADIEAKMRAATEKSATAGIEFHEMEREAREQLQNVAELVEEHPAEMRALVKALFPEGLKVTHQTSDNRRVRLNGHTAPNGAFDVILAH